MLLINFVGSPGSGKSTAAAGLFHKLKTRHWNVELVTEYTRELILMEDRWSLSDELLVFTEKYRRIKRLESVDLVITDSPLINSAVYGGDQFGDIGPEFFQSVARKFDSIYFAVRRTAPYIAVGRMPDAVAAEEAGNSIIGHLRDISADYHWIDGNDEAINGVVGMVEAKARLRGKRPLNEEQVVRMTPAAPRHAPGWDSPASRAGQGTREH